jgi:predicted aminopeptidase
MNPKIFTKQISFNSTLHTLHSTLKTLTLALSLTILLALNGCGYLAGQGAGLLRYQSRAVNIDKMLEQNHLKPEMRDFLELVIDIREFAMDSLGLKRNNNYTKYVMADREYMVDVVVASKDDAFDLYRWWFPIVGSMPYKGFFNRESAEREARKIEKKGGHDVYIGRAGAFSTLGFFSDPVYSFMINYSVYDLASIIIHEQMHATVFIKNQVRLNEEMATFVGDMGGLLYVKNRFGEDSEQYRAAVLSKEDYGAYVDLLRTLYEELGEVYGSDSSREYKLAEKERILDNFRDKVASGYDSLFGTPNYQGLKTARLNNAIIAANMTYNLDMELFHELYGSVGNDLAAVVRELKALRKVRRNHREHLRARIAAPDFF